MEIDGTDILDCWALTPADLVLVMAKNEANRVDFALQLLFYRAHGRFPNEPEEIEPGAVANIARQLGITGVAHDGFNTAESYLEAPSRRDPRHVRLSGSDRGRC